VKTKFAIIGCGLIGRKRAKALRKWADLVVCFDTDFQISKSFSFDFQCQTASSLDEILLNNEIDAVIVATRHDSLAKIAQLVMESGKHVLIEKPAARNAKEFSLILKAREKFPNLKVHVGYNHRYHPGISKAFEIYKSKEIGDLMFIRSRYGHGGRLGYEKEWRANKEISGGGELIDQGSHLLDLASALLGKLNIEYAATPNFFWDMDVEDNAFLSVKNDIGKIGFLHVSCTEWKNMFSLEIYCDSGKIEVTGLGGSYGVEQITLHKMSNQMGPPISQSWQFPGDDESWDLETNDFVKDIENDTFLTDNLVNSGHVLDLISDIYKKTSR
jgi:predicted dehydrogenase